MVHRTVNQWYKFCETLVHHKTKIRLRHNEIINSIDESFLDITTYMNLYNATPKQLAKMILDEIYDQTGITATVGIGTNLFLAKVALDITAKHAKDCIFR